MLKDNYKKQKNIKGFTLVEMLVAIAVFMIVMTVAVGSLVAIIDSNRKAQAIKNVINNINFALESISKDMRVGRDYECLTGMYNQASGNFNSTSFTKTESICDDGTLGVRYKKNSKEYVQYRFFSGNTGVLGEGGNVRKCVESSTNNNCMLEAGWDSLTAPTYNVQITNMKFYVLGADTGAAGIDQADWKQPRVLITLEGTAGVKEGIKTNFNIQTTVSQRSKETHL